MAWETYWERCDYCDRRLVRCRGKNICEGRALAQRRWREHSKKMMNNVYGLFAGLLAQTIKDEVNREETPLRTPSPDEIKPPTT